MHTAPAHGKDDFNLGKGAGLDLTANIDTQGRYTSAAGEGLKGLCVLSQGTPAVVKLIAARDVGGALILAATPLTHSYPYDWRTHQPVMTVTTQQWFLDLTAISGAAKQQLEDVSIFF